MNFDEYESKILDRFESGNLKSVGLSDSEKERLSDIASNTLTKNKRVDIRLSVHDIQAIQRKAIQEGLPYQTLISSLIHRYTNGLLVDKSKVAG